MKNNICAMNKKHGDIAFVFNSNKEGFSLVEIIITIAIMAILVGVIALAVIPNLGRSHESKDLTKLDNIASSTNIAIANNKICTSGSFVLGAIPAGNTPDRTIYDALETELGDLTRIQMESSAAEGKRIKVSWSVIDPGAAHVTVEVVDEYGNGNVACKYTKGEPGDPDGYQYFRVSNE